MVDVGVFFVPQTTDFKLINTVTIRCTLANVDLSKLMLYSGGVFSLFCDIGDSRYEPISKQKRFSRMLPK